ncbi:MAG TPA: hotdog domain-containing protein [Candidatus Dormibacteraeota bacterium]
MSRTPHPFEALRRGRPDGRVDLSPQAARLSRTEIVQVMELTDVNLAGNVHGGSIMRLADTAAGVAASRHCGQRVVTAAMDEMSFLEPVLMGDLLHVEAVVTEAFTTSVEVAVRVEVEQTVTKAVRRHVSSAYLVFVALDENGRPARVRPLIAETDTERLYQAQAQVRREQRLLRKHALREVQAAEIKPSG